MIFFSPLQCVPPNQLIDLKCCQPDGRLKFNASDLYSKSNPIVIKAVPLCLAAGEMKMKPIHFSSLFIGLMTEAFPSSCNIRRGVCGGDLESRLIVASSYWTPRPAFNQLCCDTHTIQSTLHEPVGMRQPNGGNTRADFKSLKETFEYGWIDSREKNIFWRGWKSVGKLQ